MKLLGHVAILSIAGSASTRLRQALLKEKFDNQIVRSLNEVEKLRAKWSECLVVVQFGREQDEALALLKKLLSSPQFHQLPLLVVGEEAAELKPELAKVFGIVGAKDHPCEVSEIVAEIACLWEKYTLSRAAQKEAAERGLDERVAAVNSVAPVVPGGVHPFWAGRNIPSTFFELLLSCKLLGATIGGALYGRSARWDTYRNFLDKEGVGLAELCERAAAGSDPWIKGHAIRSAYTSYVMLKALGVNRESILVCTRAALFYAVACKTKRRLVKCDFGESADSVTRRSVAKAVRESATKVSFDLRMPQESIVLALFSRLIGREEVTTDSDECKLAYALYAATTLDKACFSEGFFDPKRAYGLLRKVKSGAFSEIDPAIAVAAVKFLSEAIVGCPAKMAMPTAILRAYRERLRTALPEELKPRPSANEKRVELNDLSPGMRLSRPLCTFDGKQVLESSLKLDEDLIMRVWQLTAIRPVEPAMVTRESLASIAE